MDGEDLLKIYPAVPVPISYTGPREKYNRKQRRNQRRKSDEWRHDESDDWTG